MEADRTILHSVLEMYSVSLPLSTCLWTFLWYLNQLECGDIKLVHIWL